MRFVELTFTLSPDETRYPQGKCEFLYPDVDVAEAIRLRVERPQVTSVIQKKLATPYLRPFPTTSPLFSAGHSFSFSVGRTCPTMH